MSAFLFIRKENEFSYCNHFKRGAGLERVQWHGFRRAQPKRDSNAFAANRNGDEYAVTQHHPHFYADHHPDADLGIARNEPRSSSDSPLSSYSGRATRECILRPGGSEMCITREV